MTNVKIDSFSDGALDKLQDTIARAIGATGGTGEGEGTSGSSSVNPQRAKEKALQRGMDMAVSIITGISDIIFKQLNINLQKQRINLEAANNIFQKQIEAFSKATSVAIESITDLDAKNMVSNSIKRLGTMMDASTELFRNQIEQNTILFKREQDIKIQNIKEQSVLVDSALGAVSSIMKSVGGGVGIIVGGIADVSKSIFDSTMEYRANLIELAKTEREIVANRIQQQYQAVNDYAKNFIPMWQDNVTEIIKVEDETYALGRMFGYTRENLSTFTDGMFHVNVTMAILGKTAEDLIKIQKTYAEATGRSIQVTGEEGLNISALAMWTGISDEESARLAANMQIFNKGAMESSQSIFEMSQTASSMGLSNQKFVKDLEKNLRLAQKYDFKNGTKGLMQMQMYAQSVRMDMAQMDAILSGFHTGNIEDVITKAAQLNVLGGNAALISDPIGMLYDAYANPQGMLGRVVQSISGMGFFNQSTGETEFGIAERMRIEQMARAYGMSPETLTEMARQENKGRELNRLYGANAFGKYGERIKQQAYYENGEWKVNVMGEGGRTQAMSLDAMMGNESLLERIMPDTEQGQLLEITKQSLSAQQKIAAATEKIKSRVLEGSNKSVRETYSNGMVAAINEKEKKFIDDFVRGTIKAANNAVNLVQEFNKHDIDWNAIDAAFKSIKLTQEHMLTIAKDKDVQRMVQTILNAKDWNDMIETAEEQEKIRQQWGQYDQMMKDWNAKSKNVVIQNVISAALTSIIPPVAIANLVSTATHVFSKPKKPKTKRPVDDAIITPSGKLVTPDSQDFKVLMKPGGDVQRMLGGSQSDASNVVRSVNVSGSLYLNTDGQSVDLVELINRNPEAFYRVASEILFPKHGQSRVNS